MSGPDHRLEAAARALSKASSLAEARRMVDVWAPQFHQALDRRITAGMHPSLGMEITGLPGRGGVTARGSNSFFVGIGIDGKRERRFTLAHELAHVVLNATEHTTVDISREEEEKLCNLFARRALMPPAMIRKHLEQNGVPTDLADIKRFAAHFRVTLRASLVALDEFFPQEWPVAFVAASWRAHPRGDQVEGLRIDASAADRRIFFPTHCRLSTLGYSALEAWVLEAEVGAEARGRDLEVRARSRKVGVSAWEGTSEWVVQRHLAPATRAAADECGALCQVDIADFVPSKRKGRRGARLPETALRPVVEIPGQLRIKRTPASDAAPTRT